MYDCHLHTDFSHDSKAPLAETCEKALSAGLSGISVTDHADIEYASDPAVRKCCRGSFENSEKHKKIYEGKLKIYSGIEIGEWIWDRSAAEQILADSDFDLILGSVHAVRYKDYQYPYSRLDFSKLTDEEIDGFIRQYFEDYLETAETCDIDIAPHLTCPLRYIVGKYQREPDMARYDGQINQILKAIISRDIALEINTAHIGRRLNNLSPEPEIIKRYIELGGSKFTLGSDAHISDNVGHAFDTAVLTLKSFGIDHAYYFEKRKAIKYIFD